MAVNSPAKQTKEATLRWLVLAVLLLGFALRVYHLGTQSMWWDEVKTVERGNVTWSGLIADLLAKRHHLPLYFVLMRGWLQLGQSEFIVRAFSMFWGTLSLALVYKLGRLTADTRTGLIAAFLLAINPFHVWYSQEARLYTLLIAAILAAHIFLLCLLRNDKPLYWLGYVLAMITAVYTHLFALLILVVHYIFFALHYRFLQGRFLKWVGYTAVVGGLFAIWGLLLIQTGGLQEATPAWIAATRWSDLLLTLLAFTAGRTINPGQLLVYVVPLVYIAASFLALNQRRLRLSAEPGTTSLYQTLVARFYIFWLIVPLLLVFFVSLGLPGRTRQISIYTDRYLSIVLPAFILLAAWGLARILAQKPALFGLASFLIVIGTLPGLYNNYFQPSYGREAWRAAAQELQTAATTDIIWSQNDHQTPLAYYLDESRLQAQWIVVGALDDTTADFEAEMTERATVMQAQGQRVWLVTQFYNNDLHGFPQQRNSEVAHTAAADAQYAWMQAHFPILKDESFVGIRLTLFDLSNP